MASPADRSHLWTGKALRRLRGLRFRLVALVFRVLGHGRVRSQSITEKWDQLGHGRRIRRALRQGELPDLERLGGLGSEAYSDEVFERTYSRICDLSSATRADEALTRLRVLNHESSRAHPKYGVDSAILRALLMFTLVERQLGRFDGQQVVEIGGGIATFAATVMTLSSPKQYTIYDLPDMLRLQEMFLRGVLPRQQIDRLRFCSAHDITESEPFDLIYSTYAFSELASPVAEEYFDKVVCKARMGFMTYNHLGPRYGVENLTLSEFCNRLLYVQACPDVVEVRADEQHRLGGGGDSTSCSILWRRDPAPG